MKNKLLLTLGLLLTSLLLSAQDEKIHQEKMKVFEAWVGQWQGSGWMQIGLGEPKNFAIEELIQSKLDATVLFIEGVGTAKVDQTNSQTIVHQALAILSYDPADDQYKFRSHLKNGRSTNAWFTVSSENNFQWGFDTPQGKVRYTISIDPIAKTWHEFGEFGGADNAWRKFIEMNLKKQE